MAEHKTEFEKLFVDLMKDIYSAEKQVTAAMPKLIKGATSPELKQGFEMHLQQTARQIQRLEKISEMMGFKLGGKKCVGMEGLIKEGDEILAEDLPGIVKDAGIIAAAQKVEHYEIAAYGTARNYANLLGNREAANMLQETLNEEGETDKKLTAMAERSINQQALRQ